MSRAIRAVARHRVACRATFASPFHRGVSWETWSSRRRWSTVSSPPPADVPVVIVGGGPVGLTLSILLSRLGVDSQLVERRAAPTAHPQAHFVNTRTREIFRPMLGLDDAVARAQPPLEDWRHFIYSTRMLGGVELGRVDHFDEKGSERGSVEISPTSVAHLSQHRLEPMLLARALDAHPRGPPGSRCAPSASGSRRTTPGSPPSLLHSTMIEMVKSTVKSFVRRSRARPRFAARSWSRRTAPAEARARGWASPSPARPPCSTS